jgi:dTMP kinase
MTGRHRSRRPGLLVALEGIDGAGKSTLGKALVTALRRRGLSAVLWREPVDRALGRLAQQASVRDPWTGAVYFTLDRYLARVDLERELAKSDVVVTDRSLYSTLAYQGSALGARAVRRLEELGAAATVLPDRVVLLDMAPAVALRRLGRRSGDRGPLERRRTLDRVAVRYRRLAHRGRWLVLDARRPPPELVDTVLGDLAERLPALGGRSRARRP